MNLFVRLAWVDQRLKWSWPNETDYVVAGGDISDKLWVPDIFFPNERHGIKHSLTQNNVNLRFYPNGQIFLIVRYSLILACDMAFELFPFDTQVCILHLESSKRFLN